MTPPGVASLLSITSPSGLAGDPANLAQERADRFGRLAHPYLTWRHVIAHGRSPGKGRACPDFAMVAHSHTPCQRGRVTDLHRTGDTRESRQNGASSDGDVVGDLAEIIDLGAFGDQRVIEHTAIDS